MPCACQYTETQSFKHRQNKLKISALAVAEIDSLRFSRHRCHRHSNHSQPQFLPSFAITFSNSSLDKLPSHLASLPPIQPKPPSEQTPPISNGRKRSSYGGDKVDLSVWDLEAFFAPKQPAPQPEGAKKRKRTNDLLPREFRGAKNASRERLPEPAAARTQHDVPQLSLYAPATCRRYAGDSHLEDAFFAPATPSILQRAHSHQPRYTGAGTGRAAPGGSPMLCRKRVVRASSSCLCAVLQFSSSAMMSTTRGSDDPGDDSPLTLSQPSPKERRTTVSGPSQLVDQAPPNPTTSDANAASPPIVIGMPAMARDDLNAVEQRESGCTPAIFFSTLCLPSRGQAPTNIFSYFFPKPEYEHSARRSHSRPSSKSPGSSPVVSAGQSQQTDFGSNPPHPNSLPPSPISFAGRRAFKSPPSLKKKPADIVISPRDPRTQPVIQSAPPQQGGRFTAMALPSLPNVQQPLGGRRILGNTLPTPTRLTLHSNLAASSSTSSLTAPPPASVPISTMFVPQTPTVLNYADSTS
ncbi:hypothetical protein BJY52DRAFT_1219293 [Lactarius psammicola]|nr:hypothetical protein BJY52DRAFT_1219293 [Lactarius psammicola]